MAEKKEAEVKNIVNIEDAGPCKKKVSIEVPQEKISAALDEQYTDLRKEAQIPGFRVGRAPRRLLEKKFGSDVADQVKLKLLAEASEEAMKDNDIEVLRDPNIDYEKIELPESGPLKFDFEVEVKPDFELPELSGIKVEKPVLEVTDEQVDSELQQLRKWSGAWAPKKEGEKVEKDEQIIADAILKIKDEDKEEEKLNNTEIYVRANGFVGGVPVEKLDELLVGAKVGDKKQATAEVSKTFFKEEYRGKTVDITIEVKDIKWLKPAELDENFLNRFEVKSEDELKEKIRESLEGRQEQQARQEMAVQIQDYLTEKTDFELPTDIVAEQGQTILQRQFTDMLRQGLKREEIEEKMEQLKAGSEDQARDELKRFFVMDKVADELGVDVTEEELNGHIAQAAIQRGQRPEQLRETMMRDGSLVQFRLQVREEKSIEKLLESAEIKEVAPKDEKDSKDTAKKSAKKTSKKTTKKAEKKDKE